MRFSRRPWRWSGGPFLSLQLLLVFMLLARGASAQELGVSSAVPPELSSSSISGSDAPPQSPPAPSPGKETQRDSKKEDAKKEEPPSVAPPPQPQRILGIMPNFRAVSAGEIPPPPTPKQSFLLATKNSFDYSSFLFVGITSLLAEANNTHSQLGKGVPGFARYYWRGWVDKTDGNYWVIFILPTLFHQDERYYSMGSGGFMKRLVYSASRVLITPDYHGHASFNASELLGRGIAQGISTAYYPSKSRTAGALASKYAFAIGRDALTNTFREFWPDISLHLLRRNP